MNPRLPLTHGWAAWGIILLIACNTAGWLLSCVGAAGPPGLALAIPPLAIGIGMLAGLRAPGFPVRPWARFIPTGAGKACGTLARLTRSIAWLRTGWWIVALLALLGGILHAPNNMDAMNYRLPKVAWWLAHGGWEWMPSNNESLNTRASGMEWLFAWWIGIFRSDRWLFLTNIASFLLMPGLVFSLMRGMGAARAAALAWMWILPCGYGFALQAGGIGNDLPAAVLALAAFDFGWRWKRTALPRDAFLAIGAAVCMTAVKPTTLPLCLPLLFTCYGMVRVPFSAPLRTALLCVPFLLASFLPTAVLNQRACGDWTGAKAENPALGSVEPAVGLAGNLINSICQNLAPPVFPMAESWNTLVPSLFPENFLEAMERNFEARGAKFGLTDIQGEESAGLGLGVSGLFLASWLAVLMRGNWRIPRGAWLASAWVMAAMLTYFCKAGMTTVARHVMPFYLPLIIPALCASGFASIARSRIWQWSVLLAVASSAAMLLITPSRPVLPMAGILEKLSQARPGGALARARLGFSVYANRYDVLAPLREALPTEAKFVGFINHATGPETPLWRPYGTRVIRHLRPDESPGKFRKKGMSHLILNTQDFERIRGESPAAWLSRNNGRIVFQTEIRTLVKEPASTWWVVQLP